LSVTWERLHESTGLDADRPEVPNPSEEFRGRSPECLGDLHHGRERRVATAGLHGAEIVGGELRTFGQLLEREPESLSSSTYDLSEIHKVELCARMPSVTTIGGVANQPEGVVSLRIGGVPTAPPGKRSGIVRKRIKEGFDQDRCAPRSLKGRQ
jgi:hypothetical protein